jgi:2-Cys peroxiredoxin 5
VAELVTAGSTLPPVTVGRLVPGTDLIEPVPMSVLLQGRRAVLFGVPGAFTPVCTREHIPGFVEHADRLRRAGVDEVICLAPNDPWTIAAWSSALDPEGKVTFLSDGNLSFAHRLGIVTTHSDFFMGERPSRYLLTAYDNFVESMTIESSPLALTCTRAEDVPLHAFEQQVA